MMIINVDLKTTSYRNCVCVNCRISWFQQIRRSVTLDLAKFLHFGKNCHYNQAIEVVKVNFYLHHIYNQLLIPKRRCNINLLPTSYLHFVYDERISEHVDSSQCARALKTPMFSAMTNLPPLIGRHVHKSNRNVCDWLKAQRC